MTPSGIEPTTFGFVAQHLNHCATAVPGKAKDILQNTDISPYNALQATLPFWNLGAVPVLLRTSFSLHFSPSLHVLRAPPIKLFWLTPSYISWSGLQPRRHIQMHRLPMWIHPLGTDKISTTNRVISPLKACHTLPQPRVAPGEPPLWGTTNIQKWLYMQSVLRIM